MPEPSAPNFDLAMPERPEIEGVNEWAFCDEDRFLTYVYRLDETDDEKARRPDDSPKYFRRIDGQIDPEVVREQCGGGYFLLKILVDRELKYTRKLRVLGPRLTDDDIARVMRKPDPPVVQAPVERPAPQLDAAALATTIAASLTQALAPMLERVTREPATQPLTLDAMLTLVDRVRGSGSNAVDPNAMVKASMDMFTRGIDLAKRETGQGRSFGDALVESMPHILEGVDKMLAARAAAAPVPTATHLPPAPGSQPQAAGSAPSASQVANLALATMVANALEQHVEPADFADVLETLYGDEAKKLASLGADVAIGVLTPYAKFHPVLGTPALREYVVAVIEQLKTPPGDEPDGASAAAVE